MFVCQKKCRKRSGVAAAELAIVLPVVVVILVGTWEMGRMVHVKTILRNAVREGGALAASGKATDSEVKTFVKQYVKNAGLPSGKTTVNVTNHTDPSRDASEAEKLDKLEVKVSMPFSDVDWVALNFFVSDGADLNASSVWLSVPQ